MNQLQFLRALVVLNGAVPLVMLLWDAYRGQLGANSVNNALHITGILSLVFLFLSLLMSPLKWVTGWGGWIAFLSSARALWVPLCDRPSGELCGLRPRTQSVQYV